MNRIVKAVLWAIPPVAVLVVLPQILLGYVPASTMSQASSLVGVSIPGLIDDVAIFGVALAVLSAIQTWAYKWSIVKPVATTFHMLVSYVLLLFLLGFGNSMAFGTMDLSVNLSALGTQMSGIGPLSISLVSTFLALMVGVAVVLKAGQKWMKYVEDKRFHALDLSEAAVVAASPLQT
jgi:hypothetical protein